MKTPKLKVVAFLLWFLVQPCLGETGEIEGDDKSGVAPAAAIRPPDRGPKVPIVAARPAKPHAHMGYNFDWDDNIMNMKTTIIAFRKGTDGTKPEDRQEFSTAKWAEVRNLLGQAGEYENWEKREGPKGSYVNFFDQRGKNNFLDQIFEAMKGDPKEWKGPSWDAFVAACKRPETARYVTLITARGHSRQKMHAALKKLHEMGLIDNVPPMTNIYPVGNPSFYAGSDDTSERKAIYMTQILDRFQKLRVQGDADVTNSDGTGRQRMHLWGFSDDDYGNFTKAKEDFAKAAKAKPGRWSNIKITLFYTGTKKEGVKPHAVVMTSTGDFREVPLDSPELQESETILEPYPPCRAQYKGVRGSL